MTRDLSITLLLAAATTAGTAIGTRRALAFVKRRQILDQPNERSSHTLPTPRGLGLGVIPVVLLAWAAALSLLGPVGLDAWVVAGGAAVLATLSWIDDVRQLPAWPRLLAQVGLVVAGVATFDDPQVFAFGGIPTWLGQCACVVLWVGLINQVNFTDGIDGNLGGFLSWVGLGLFAVTCVSGVDAPFGALALVVAAAAAGFLPINWHPAKAFMGDVGSVPLGFIVGWLLLRFASLGHWIPVVVLPLLYFTDTAVTYSGRIARREPFWRPHRLYAYQRATRTLPHSRIVAASMACNASLIAITLASMLGPKWLAVAAVIPVAITYRYLARAARPDGQGT